MVLPNVSALHFCDEAEKLYMLYCDLADARGKKKEAREAWRIYLKHRRACKECTPLQRYKTEKENDNGNP